MATLTERKTKAKGVGLITVMEYIKIVTLMGGDLPWKRK